MSSCIPEVFDAFQAVIVPTWDGGGIVEDIQTDAASKLFLSQRRGHISDREITLCYSYMHAKQLSGFLLS